MSETRCVQDLCGTWELREEPNGNTAPVAGEWIPAGVPGDIHLDLLAAGLIPDPFYGVNYRDGMFAELSRWRYRTTFVPERGLARMRRVELVFDGLDTFATVLLNGEEIATARNMWIPLRIDVSEKVKPGEENTLEVLFDSLFRAVADDMAADDSPGTNAFFTPKERVYARKAQMGLGWDIAPRVCTCGIWRPVRLVGYSDGAIRDVRVRAALRDDGSALVTIAVEAEAFAQKGEWTATVDMGNGLKPIVLREIDSGPKPIVSGVGQVVIPDPRLWWTWDLGTAHLYDLAVSLRRNGAEVESWSGRLGIREVKLHLTDPESGESRFYFTLNGRPTFILGTNWIPTDAIFARVTRERLSAAIDLAKELGCNMFRIWGGGIYEDPAFYDLCDELGILVWQDFMFACGIYPQNERFLAEVRAEAESVVRSLRNHPCLAIWAGDNECDCSYAWAGGDPEAYLGNRVTREVLPEVCAALDPDRPYIPSSPFNPSGKGDPNTDPEGDIHIWSHNAPPRGLMYFADKSKLISEIGRIAPANLESIRRFLPESAQWPHDNPVWDQHLGTIPTSDFRRRDRMDEALVNVLGAVPDSLEAYVERSQLLQAFCLSEWIQRARRRWPECGGILWWNLFDNWPQHSDAVVDYYFAKKIGYYAVRDASRPVMPSIAPVDGGWEAWLLNRTDVPRHGTLTVDVVELSGSVRTLAAAPWNVLANSAQCVVRVSAEQAGTPDPNSVYLRAAFAPTFGPTVTTEHVIDGCSSVEVLRRVYGALATRE